MSKISSGLTSNAYTDENFWNIECETVFAKNWVFVGCVHEIIKSGDVVPVSVAGNPIVLVKNLKGKIVAFHNVCSHRCLKLVDKVKNVGKLIRCPYHSWAYDLDGKLRASPYFGGTNQKLPKDFDPAKHGLKPVRIKTWHDWIFINLNGKAAPFEKYAASLFNHLQDVNFNKIYPVAVLDFGKISTNWKFLIENFIEPYHVQFVHRKTTSQPLKDHYTIVDGFCLGSAIDMDNRNKKSNTLSVSSRYLALFPNFVIGKYFPNLLGIHLNIPHSPGCTSQKRIIYTTDEQKLTKREIKSLKELWWDVHKEDHEICERLQLGRYSPIAKSGGILSPYWEKGVHAFHKLINESTMKSLKDKKREKYV